MADSSTSTPRVPAWKRLGLKLKYAKDEVQMPGSTPENGSASKKRSRPVESYQDGRSSHLKESSNKSEGKNEDKKSKKRKLSQDDTATTSNSRSVADESTTPDKQSKKDKKQKKSEKSKNKEQNFEASTSKPKPSIPDHAVSTPIKTLKRKKSVSFTPDTKAIDGDQHLVKAWSSSLRQEEPSIPSSETTEPAPSAVKDANKPSKAELKQAKKEAKRKAKNDAAASTSTASTVPADVPPFLTYLQQYHTDRANWKFNKVKQGALFDNLFKIQRLPAPYDGALRAYLEGLKGDAVRQRLQEQAREILEKTRDEKPNGADANLDTSSASSSSDSDSESSSDSSSDSDADSGSPTPSAATAASGDEKMALSPAKSAALKRQLERSAARRREERIKKDASGASTSADQQLLLAQRCRAQMIVEVLGPKEVQLVKAQKERVDKKKKEEVESESSDESSVVSSSSEDSDSEDSDGGEDSGSEDDSGSDDESSSGSSSSSSSSEDDSD